MTISPPRKLRIVTFALYAALLFTLTHWPNLAIENDFYRPDLVIHMGTFGLWAALCTFCAFFGPALSVRNVLLSGLVAGLYACVDEALQGFTFLHRHAAWDDLGADMLGVTLVIVGALILGALTRAGRRSE